ncbi:MAG: hypothetical protein ACJ74U_10985 [Jatrophihabitantaceae bacterium]
MEGDALLLGFELVQRYGPGVVGLEEFVALVAEPHDDAAGALNLPVTLRQRLLQVLVDLIADGGNLGGGHRDGAPVHPHFVLDQINGEGPESAAVALLLAPHAVEVVVATALAVADNFDAEYLAA